MRDRGHWLQRIYAYVVLVALAPAMLMPAAASAQQAPDGSNQQATPAAPAQTPASSSGTAAPDGQSVAAPASPPAPILPVRDGTQPTPPDAQTAAPTQTVPKPPVGTAAAPYEKGIGVAASRPAGAVIAPAKQRRTRSLLIKVGIVVAAAVAVGTVAALSSGSPSSAH